MSNISIVIPVYNAELSLKRCLKSILSQTYNNWELIIINDGSTDNSLKIIEGIIQHEKRIKLINQENAGPSIARNVGINIASSKYICFVDADDYVSSNYLESLINSVNKYGSDLVCAGYYECNHKNTKGIKLHDFKDSYPKKTINKSEFIDNLFTGLTGVLWSKLFRTSIIKNNNIKLNSKLRLSEDLLFVLKYARHINNISLLYDSIYYYSRLDEDSLSGKISLNKYNEIKLFNYLITKEFINSEPEFDKNILYQRTSKLLVQSFKDYSFSSDSLKDAYSTAKTIFDEEYFQAPLKKSDRIFFYLLKNKYFSIAVFQQYFIRYMKSILYA